MIYAQRPDATACASMELWNDTMWRWVKPRSKGIALIRTGAVSEALERQYGPSEETDIGWQLMEQAKRAVGGAYRDYLEDLRYDTRDGLLEELDDLNLKVRFRNVLTASAQYTLLTRCGLPPATT